MTQPLVDFEDFLFSTGAIVLGLRLLELSHCTRGVLAPFSAHNNTRAWISPCRAHLDWPVSQQSLSMTKRFFARRWPGKAAGGICGAGASSGGGSNGGGCGTGAGPGAGAAVAEAAPWTPPWRRRLPGPPPAVSRPRAGRRGRSDSRGGGPKSRTTRAAMPRHSLS